MIVSRGTAVMCAPPRSDNTSNLSPRKSICESSSVLVIYCELTPWLATATTGTTLERGSHSLAIYARADGDRFRARVEPHREVVRCSSK